MFWRLVVLVDLEDWLLYCKKKHDGDYTRHHSDDQVDGYSASESGTICCEQWHVQVIIYIYIYTYISHAATQGKNTNIHFINAIAQYSSSYYTTNFLFDLRLLLVWPAQFKVKFPAALRSEMRQSLEVGPSQLRPVAQKFNKNKGIHTTLGGGFNFLKFNFHPYLGKIPNFTNIFQRGWNHQLELTAERMLEFVFYAASLWGLL